MNKTDRFKDVKNRRYGLFCGIWRRNVHGRKTKMEKLKQSQTSLTKPQIKLNQIDRRTDRQADSRRKKGFVFKSILRRKPNLHENAKT